MLLSGPMEALGRDRLPRAMQGSAPVGSAKKGKSLKGKSLKAQLEHPERTLIAEALERNGGVLRRAAKELDVDPQTFARRARKLGAL